MTIGIYVASVVLALLSLGLFVVAIRRLLSEQSDRVTVMLERYDERLAALTRVITDTLYAARIDAGERARGLHGDGDQNAMLRTLELARARTSTDAAIAIVTGSPGESVASVGLSHEEAAEVTRIGLPDYRGARALEISFTSEIAAHNGQRPVCSGLSVPLLPSPSMLAVLTRSPSHRFSEEDVEVLQELADAARPATEGWLELPPLGVNAEPEPRHDFLDRQSFPALCAEEIGKRPARSPLSLLVVEVDRLAAIKDEFGHPVGDLVVEEIGERLRRLTGPGDFSVRLDGGRFGVLLSRADGRAADELFTRLRDSLATRPPEGVGSASASGGVAELLPSDTPATLLDRAETALGMAKSAGAGSIVSTTPH